MSSGIQMPSFFLFLCVANSTYMPKKSVIIIDRIFCVNMYFLSFAVCFWVQIWGDPFGCGYVDQKKIFMSVSFYQFSERFGFFEIWPSKDSYVIDTDETHYTWESYCRWLLWVLCFLIGVIPGDLVLESSPAITKVTRTIEGKPSITKVTRVIQRQPTVTKVTRVIEGDPTMTKNIEGKYYLTHSWMQLCE